MTIGTRVTIFLLLASQGNLIAQQLSHQVLVPVAGIISTGDFNYTQTGGETAVEIISSPDFVFTQGFQQPGIKYSKEDVPAGNGVKVYPNPVTDYLYIELFGSGARSFRIDIINLTGTIILNEKLDFNEQFWHREPFSFDKLSIGLYFVRIISDDGIINRTFKIEKM
jgi:hypothetical protein